MKSKVLNAIKLVPMKYVDQRLSGVIEPDVLYCFEFLPKSIATKGQFIYMVGDIYYDQRVMEMKMMHSIKLVNYFKSAINKIKLKFIGALYTIDGLIKFPKLSKNFIHRLVPVYDDYTEQQILEYITNISSEEIKNALIKIHQPKNTDDINDGFATMHNYERQFIHYMFQEQITDKIPMELNPVFNFPFELTDDQQNAHKQIYQLLEQPRRMIALVNGDVGCGKTIVAFIAALKVVANFQKVLIMVPNLLLVNQIYEVFKKLAEYVNLDFSINIVTGKVKELHADITVGTSALLNQEFRNIGLCIIDEQHKFGVLQRSKLTHKCHMPHLLMLTATPIPRTLQMTLEDLVHSMELHTKPNTGARETFVVSTKKLESIKQGVMEAAKSQKRILWVCRSVALVMERYTEFQHTINTKFLHGGLKDKVDIMAAFKETGGLLISTTVVEVGIDLPIDIIVIEDAHMFGLAQIHQLRGRVGRRNTVDKCILIGNNLSKLNEIKYCDSGYELSLLDLEKRGSGTMHDSLQSGNNMVFNKRVTAGVISEYSWPINPHQKLTQDIIDFYKDIDY